jgi:uncharacterized membrane protein
VPTPYTTIAGQSVERLAALSDGVFAIAMTLLVLDLRVPAAAALHGDGDLFRHVFVALAPRFVPYLLSFMSLGIYWIGQQTQLNHFARSNRTLTWIQLGFLLAVTLIPFSTALLAEYIGYRLAVVAYWINLALLGGALFASIRYAERAGLLKEVVTAELRATHERRIVRYQMMYAVGAALCVVNSYVSIAFIIFLQLCSVLDFRFTRKLLG